MDIKKIENLLTFWNAKYKEGIIQMAKLKENLNKQEGIIKILNQLIEEEKKENEKES